MDENVALSEELVSIITPVYNCEEYIAQAIESVLAQTYQNWEMILIDDCSTDNSPAIIASCQERDDRIKYVKLDNNSGVAIARNTGMEEARGRYVAFLDGDDYWKPEMLEKMVACADNTAADIVYCSYEIVDELGAKVCNDFVVPEETDYRKSLVKSVILPSAALMAGRLAKESRFPTDMYHEDIALWFQILRDGGKARGVSDVLVSYRRRSGSKTAHKVKTICGRWIVYRRHLRTPFFRSIGLMAQYAYYGFLKYRRI